MFSAMRWLAIEVAIDAPADKDDGHPVHTAAKVVCDARFARIVQEVAADHAEREAAGCDDNQLRHDTPHAVSHGLIGF
jgi:hypothetical protein